MSFCPTNDGPRPRGRPPKRKPADFTKLPLPERRSPDPAEERATREWQSLREFAGRFVDPDDPQQLMALVWPVAVKLGKQRDREAEEVLAHFWKRLEWAAESESLVRLRETILRALKQLRVGFPSPAERERRARRAARKRRRG